MSENCMKVMQYVHQHYNENLTLRGIAEMFFINPAYLGRMFTRQVGMSFADYLQHYRMQKAMQLLGSKDIKVMEVARAVGYNNMNYFYRVFHEHTGVTPTQYRVDAQKMVNGTGLMDMRQQFPNADDILPEGRVVCSVEALPGVMGGMVALRSGIVRYYYPVKEGEITVLRYVDSMDDGTIWTAPKTAELPESIEGISSLDVLNMRDGSVGLFILRPTPGDLVELLSLRSYDDGDTWQPRPERLRLPDGYRLQSSRMLRLRSGRLVLPFTRTVIERDRQGGPEVVRHYISDDDGLSWSSSRTDISLNCRHSRTGLRYPAMLETRAGVLMGWAATDMGRQYEYCSWDGGESWGGPQPSGFTSPLQPMSVSRVWEGRVLIVFNPVPDYETGTARESRLIYMVSRSEDKDWSRAVVLEEGRDGSGSCGDPAVFIQQDALLLAYRKNGGTICLRRIGSRALTEVSK